MLVPKLRFKEFKGEWIYEDLGKLSENIAYGMNSAATEFDGRNKYIRITDIDEKSSLFDQKNLVSPLEKLEDKFLVQEDDVLFARTGASTGKTYLYNKNDGVLYYAGFLIKASIKKTFNSRFVFEQFNLKRYSDWVKLMSMRSGQPGINANEYSSYKLAITSKEEQDKISRMLELINKKIELQTKKVEALKLYKKGVILTIRNNNNNWKEYKIKQIFNITRGEVIPKNTLSEKITKVNKFPVYSSQTSNEGILGYGTNYKFDGKYLTWTTDGANAGRVFYRNGKFNCTNVCGILYEDNILYTNELVSELLNYETPKHVSYVGNPKLMNNIMSEIKIKLPCFETQTTVSLFLNMINKKINQESDKSGNLKKLKNGLLQKMFI